MNFIKKHKPWSYILIILLVSIFAYKLIDKVDSVFKYIGLVWDALTPFVIGFVIAYLVNQPCKSISKLFEKSKVRFLKKHSKGLGVLVVYSVLLIIITIVLRMILPALYNNIVDLFSNMPYYIQNALKFVENLQQQTDIRLINFQTLSVENAVNYFIKEVDINQFAKYAEGIISATSGIMDVFIAIIVSVYMSLDKERIAKNIKRVISILFPEKISKNLFEYISKINNIFSKYIYCKVIEAVIIMILSTIILNLFGVKYALILGIMTGFLNFIPYFGSIISTVLTIVITIFSTGIAQAFWAGISLLVLEQVDGNFIGPKIIGDVLDMRPIWVIFSVTLGGGLFGFFGMLLSTPVVMVIQMILRDIILMREKQINSCNEKDES